MFEPSKVRDGESVSVRSVLELKIIAWTLQTEFSARKSACKNEENLLQKAV